MRHVSSRIGRGAVLLVLVFTFAIYADEPSPFDPPQNRISPPGGVAAPSDEPTVAASDENRISPPGGIPTSQVRVSPPVGTLTRAPQRSVFESFRRWLQTFVRILPPIG